MDVYFPFQNKLLAVRLLSEAILVSLYIEHLPLSTVVVRSLELSGWHHNQQQLTDI